MAHGLRYADAKNQNLVRIIDEKLHTLDYKEAKRFYRWFKASKPRDNDIALLGCNDRFYLLTVILHRKDANHPWLFDRCREVEADEFGYLDLWARYHYKSTIITFAGSIQGIIRDPEITIGIFAATKAIARPFLSQIKDEFETNDDLMRYYPDVFYANPRKESTSWALDRGITVKRKSNPKEKTVEAFGLVDGMPTGRHFRRLVYDDLVTVELVSNPEMIQKVTQRWELSDNLGCGEGTEKVHAGTRYDFADTYGILMNRGSLKPRIYAATEDGTLSGKPVFLSPNHWEKVKNDQRTTVSAQMLQNPAAGNQNMFMPGWMRPYEIRPAILNVYIMADPSRGKTARSDRTAMAVIGIDAAGNKYLLDGVRHRMSLSQRWKMLRDLYVKWSGRRGTQQIKVGYERYGQQSDDEYFQEKMREPGEVSFLIEELAWPQEGQHSKKARVERLEPDFRLGRFYLPALIREKNKDGKAIDCLWSIDEEKSIVKTRPMAGLTKSMRAMMELGESNRVAQPIWRLDETGKPYDVTLALIEEMMFFPFAPHDDLVDAASRIYDMKPITPSLHETASADKINNTHHEDA